MLPIWTLIDDNDMLSVNYAYGILHWLDNTNFEVMGDSNTINNSANI